MGLVYGSELQKATAERSFWNTYWGRTNPFSGLIYEKPSNQKTSTLTRLGAAPMPTEWQADRNAKDANEYSFDVTNVPYDASVRVDKELILYEQWDEVAGLISSLGSKAQDHKVKLASTLIEAGTAAVGDDGQYFFDTDHADPGASYSTSQDNDLTTSIVAAAAPTDIEMAALIRKMFTAFWSFKDDRGDPMCPLSSNPNDFVLMVPPGYRAKALQIQRSPLLTGSVGNELVDQFQVEVNPYFTGTATAYLFYRGASHFPIIQQIAQDVTFTDYIDPHSGDYIYSASWHGKLAYGQWRTVVLHTSTTT